MARRNPTDSKNVAWIRNTLLMIKCSSSRIFVMVLFILSFHLKLQAAFVDTVSTYSASMKKEIKAVMIRPSDYATGSAFPVVYLLHGHGGDYSDWIKKVPEISGLADLYHFIIVCPDGSRAGWYFDSPVDSSYRYETYISRELVAWVDGHYKTIRNRAGRGIAGLSMGGHGALYLAFRHQDVFGATGSMSGGVDLRPFPKNWEISERLGDYARYPERWNDHSVVNLTYLLKPDSLAIMIDCGTADFFYPVNLELHEKLLLMNIPHDFIARPGDHSWPYWANAIRYQLLFMHIFFEKGHGNR
jgi:S-formylglutathione hydrolase FrmB